MKHLKIKLGTNDRSNQIKPHADGSVQNSQFIVDIGTDQTDNSSNAKSNYDECQGLRAFNDLSSKALQCDDKDDINVQILNATESGMTTKPSLNILRDLLKESLESVTQKLEKIETANKGNEIQFQKLVENNEAQCKETEKNMKDIKEEMKMQHRETRRRIERLEKKTSTGYFN